jgi:hypothetical protein
MQDMARNVKRTPNGSIDYAHYDRLARRLRGRAAHRSAASQRNAMLMVLGVATKATWRSVESLAAASWRVCRAIVRFWNIPALEPAE